jgi:hypothetical protein
LVAGAWNDAPRLPSTGKENAEAALLPDAPAFFTQSVPIDFLGNGVINTAILHQKDSNQLLWSKFTGLKTPI